MFYGLNEIIPVKNLMGFSPDHVDLRSTFEDIKHTAPNTLCNSEMANIYLNSLKVTTMIKKSMELKEE